MRRLKGLLKICFIIASIFFFSASAINQKYCKPVTRIVLLHEESQQIDIFALNNIKAKNKVYDDLILYTEVLNEANKTKANKQKTSLEYLEMVRELDLGYCFINNELEIKSILDERYANLLNDGKKANTQYFPVEELHGINKSKGYLLLLSKMLYYSFAITIIIGWVLLVVKVVEIIINWGYR